MTMAKYMDVYIFEISDPYGIVFLCETESGAKYYQDAIYSKFRTKESIVLHVWPKELYLELKECGAIYL